MSDDVARQAYNLARRRACPNCAALQARVTALEAGLRPFAATADGFPDLRDDCPIYGTITAAVKVGDLRRARALLEGKGDE